MDQRSPTWALSDATSPTARHAATALPYADEVMSETVEPSIIVDVWVVSDGSQEEFMDALVGVFERVSALEGFVGGGILKGVDPTAFVSYATMRSASERDAAFMDSEVTAMMRAIGGIARPTPHSYTIARRFTPAASAEAGD